MQIVIKLSDETYKDIKEENGIYGTNNGLSVRITGKVVGAIQNSTSLPKGHGDLVDRSKICKAIPAEEDNCTGMGMTYDEMDAYNDGIDVMYNLVQGAKAIIEADKEVRKNEF